MASGGNETLSEVKEMQQQKRAQKPEKERSRLLPSRHGLHRSAVPFFCCGSQLSINSITEIKDIPVKKEKVIDDDYEDLSDSDELLENLEAIDLHPTENKQDRFGHRSAHLVNSKRKKNLAVHHKAINRKKFWSTKLSVKLKSSNKKSQYASESELSSPTQEDKVCVCTAYRSSTLEASERVQAGGLAGNSLDVGMATTQHILPSTCSDFVVHVGEDNINRNSRDRARIASRLNAPLPFINNLNELYPVNDIDEQLIAQRRFEMEHGIELGENGDAVWLHQSELNNSQGRGNGMGPSGQYPSYGALGLCSSESLSNGLGTSVNMQGLSWSHLSLNMTPGTANISRPLSGIHTQVDYKHYLVPDLNEVINSSYYWGVMDRYQAEKLIENKAEGTFLLRDSAQDEYLFSVSFRRYGRSLHARIEQWNHRFSFDSRDPGVFATYSVCGLMEHYKDPSSCMFFEPMLTVPLHRTYPFTLQHLTRAAICSNITYDGISKLSLPTSLKEYLRFYHYKQKVRVRRFDYVP